MSMPCFFPNRPTQRQNKLITEDTYQAACPANHEKQIEKCDKIKYSPRPGIASRHFYSAGVEGHAFDFRTAK